MFHIFLRSFWVKEIVYFCSYRFQHNSHLPPPPPPFGIGSPIYYSTKIKILIKTNVSTKWKCRKPVLRTLQKAENTGGGETNLTTSLSCCYNHQLGKSVGCSQLPGASQSREKPATALLIQRRRNKVCSFTPAVPLRTEQDVGQDEIRRLLQ